MKVKGFLIHCCLLDPWCWKGYFQFATPMQLYVGKRCWTILNNTKRFRRMWGDPSQWRRLE